MSSRNWPSEAFFKLLALLLCLAAFLAWVTR